MFDSGVGGLGVFQAVARLLPNEDIVYVAGNKYMPFGEKTVEQIQQISEKIVRFLIDKHDVKVVVIACNTATVASITYLRARFSIPFVGVVPVVKPACAQTKTGCVAIMSTPLTAEGTYIKDLIAKFGQGARVLSIGCPGLADLVETGMVGTSKMEALLRKLIAPAIEDNADVIGLCSTHYPFVREQLQKIVGPAVAILDSNEPVARQVKRVLSMIQSCSIESDGGLSLERRQPQYQFYATKDAEKFMVVAEKLIGPLGCCVKELSL